MVDGGSGGILISPSDEQSIILSCTEHTHLSGHQKSLLSPKIEKGEAVGSLHSTSTTGAVSTHKYKLAAQSCIQPLPGLDNTSRHAGYPAGRGIVFTKKAGRGNHGLKYTVDGEV